MNTRMPAALAAAAAATADATGSGLLRPSVRTTIAGRWPGRRRGPASSAWAVRMPRSMRVSCAVAMVSSAASRAARSPVSACDSVAEALNATIAAWSAGRSSCSRNSRAAARAASILVRPARVSSSMLDDASMTRTTSMRGASTAHGGSCSASGR